MSSAKKAKHEELEVKVADGALLYCARCGLILVDPVRKAPCRRAAPIIGELNESLLKITKQVQAAFVLATDEHQSKLLEEAYNDLELLEVRTHR